MPRVITDTNDYSDSSSESSWSSESSPVTPGIRVRYSVTVPEEHPAIYAHALKAEVVSAIGYPSHIFVFQRSKTNTQGEWIDEFIQIASPLDIEEVPEDAPDLMNNMPYYRTTEVTVWFRTIEDLKLAKEKIKDDIRTLVNTYDVLNGALETQEEETYE